MIQGLLIGCRSTVMGCRKVLTCSGVNPLAVSVACPTAADPSVLMTIKAVYTKALIALRRENPVLLSDSFDNSCNGTGYPELSFHSCEPWQLDQNAPALTFGYMFAQDRKKHGCKMPCFCSCIWN